MEENTSKSCSTKSCCFSFSAVLKAGFFAAILTNILMIFQGNNALFYFGTLFLGTEADPKIIYTIGVLVACIIGIIFALIYALILAPLHFLNDLIKAIIFAAILTAISYYGSPELPKAANAIIGHSASSTTLVPIDEVNTAAAHSAQPFLEKTQKALIVTFSNSLLFAFMVISLYRRKCCRTRTKTENTTKN